MDGSLNLRGATRHFGRAVFLKETAMIDSMRLSLVCGAVLLVGCGVDQNETQQGPEVAQNESALTTTLYAVRPNRVIAATAMTGTPFSAVSDLYKDINDAQPDFDASYINGSGGTTDSHVDLGFAPPSPDGPVTAVNNVYFARNVLCTAAGLCGTIHTELLNGTTVVAVSASHQLPNQEQGWYEFNDSFTIPVGQITSVNNLRTRVVLSHFLPYSTAPQHVSTVAASITYNH